MTIKTFTEIGNPGKAPVRSKGMAFGTLQTGSLPMLQMTEKNRLILPGMDQSREGQPADNQGGNHPQPKIIPGIFSLTFFFHTLALIL